MIRSEMDKDERLVVELLKKNYLRPERFSNEEKHRSKTPDFRVFKIHKLAFFCEVKTVSKDEWLDKQFDKAPSDVIVGGVRNDPIFNNLSNKIHEAVQQFNAVNPRLIYPNVLVFVNHNHMCDCNDLIAVTTGNFLAEGGRKSPIYRAFSEGRIKKEKLRISLYIWRDESEGKEIYLFNQSTNEHLIKLCSYLKRNPKSIKSV